MNGATGLWAMPLEQCDSVNAHCIGVSITESRRRQFKRAAGSHRLQGKWPA